MVVAQGAKVSFYCGGHFGDASCDKIRKMFTR